ncbi:NAD(P)H-dependent glycerol-3-phosphate dehydrogenase [Patescibacteria group bacterium]|nr:MAG: NAD(P)H-dependent glycerol-3-phosphate dehydrogenase [Patescibacteria group bacterium]
MPKKAKIAVLGAGNMGTAMAQVLAKNGHQVYLWNHEGDREPLEQIKRWRENKKYSPGIKLSPKIVPEKDLRAAVADAEIIFFAVPSNFMSAVVRRSVAFLKKDAVCVDVSKGLDEKTMTIIPRVMQGCLPKNLNAKVVSISGPAIANELAAGGFTAMNIAGADKAAVAKVKRAMESKNLRLRACADILGVEITGSFKNVYAIAMGVCDGLKMPLNTKAALLVLALKEIGRLIKKMGGRAETVYDLAGLGDVVGTGLSYISRNRRFGEYLARGLAAKSALKKVGQTVEGLGASRALICLAGKYRLKMPFAETIFQITEGKAKAKAAMAKLLAHY